MSTTLDTLFTLQNWHAATEHVDILAHGGHGGRGGSRHFFFLGGGSGGSAFFILPLIAIGAFVAYLVRNPDKAAGLKGRLRGAVGAASAKFNGQQPGGESAYRFNPPPGWPTPPREWRPPSDWAPDPSWPPAPQGWQFWVPENSGQHYGSGYAA